MIIRQMGPSETDKVAEIHNASHSEWIESLGGQYKYRRLSSADVENWLKGGQDDENCILVAEQDHRLVGYIHCRLQLEEDDQSIPVLYVHPTDLDMGQSKLGVVPASKRQGIATELLNSAILHDWDDRPNLDVALVYSDNVAAKALLSSAGCRRYDVFKYDDYSKTKPLANSSNYATLDLSGPMPSVHVPEGVTIRPATVEDCSEVMAVHRANIWWAETQSQQSFVRDFLRGAFGHTVVVAESDGTVVGDMDCEADGRVGIGGVLPELRGRGIGSALFTELLLSMRRAGIKEALTDSGVTQVDAIKMYERFGFSIVRKQEAWVGIIPSSLWHR